MFGAGVAVSLNKGDVPGVSKRKLVQVVNTQAQHIDELARNNQQLAQDNQDMKAMLMQMQERLTALEKANAVNREKLAQ